MIQNFKNQKYIKRNYQILAYTPKSLKIKNHKRIKNKINKISKKKLKIIKKIILMTKRNKMKKIAKITKNKNQLKKDKL